jgi:hypothetical protein
LVGYADGASAANFASPQQQKRTAAAGAPRRPF